MVKNKTHVIWDWNGTLLNDVVLGHQVFAQICEAHELGSPSLDDYRSYYQHPIELMYQAAGFDLERVSMSSIAEMWHSGYGEGLPHAKLHDDARSVLDAFHARGVSQSVLSALPHGMLTQSIEFNQVGHYFHRVSGLSDNLGRSKVDNGITLFKELGAHPDEVILFGDSSHDLETAEALGIDCVLFARGYEGAAKLARHPVPVFADFAPILAELGAA